MKYALLNRRIRTGVAVLTLLSMGVLLLLGQTQYPCHGAEMEAIAPPADWLSRVQGDLATLEYQITWQASSSLPAAEAKAMRTFDSVKGEGYWQAPNRANNFRTYYSGKGPRVVSRNVSKADWVWGLELIEAPAIESTSAQGNRIEFHRAGGLVEWYVNDAKGIEQGFTLSESPATGGSEVILELAVCGDLRPWMENGKAAVSFCDDGGRVLIQYGSLRAWDTTGRDLPARMDLLEGSDTALIRLTIDALDAVFPITIDPLANVPDWLSEGDQGGEFYGTSVALAGDVNGDGYSDVIIGATEYDNGQTRSGAAFVYHGSAAGLSATPDWTGQSDQADSGYGQSLASAGDINADGYSDIVIGASTYDAGQPGEGRVFVHYGSPSGLSSTPDWTAGSGQSGALFGVCVASAGDVNGDGYSDVVVGASSFDSEQADAGAAFIYRGSVAGLPAQPSWSCTGDQTKGSLGNCVASAGDVNGDGFSDVIIGAVGYTHGEDKEGRVYVYHGSATGVQATPAWISEPDQVEASYGNSVATAGDVNGDGFADVIIGAPRYTHGQMAEGRTFVYYGSADGLAAQASWTNENDQEGAQFGSSVASAGDINCDGYADVLIGAYHTDYEGVDEGGKAYLYYGAVTGLANLPMSVVQIDQSGACLGGSVAAAGDVNGDGFGDLIVGASGTDTSQLDTGLALVYFGSASGLRYRPGWTADGGQGYAEYGWSVASAGDVNGDGYSDVIVGAAYYDHGEQNEGRAYVYHGSASGLSITAAWTAESNQTNALFGNCVASAGDVNEDGYDDVIVGAPEYDIAQKADAGQAFIYFGSPSGLTTEPAWTAVGNLPEAKFGACVASAGDINGDGYGDIIIGALYYSHWYRNEGAAFLYCGSPTGPSAMPAWNAEGGSYHAFYGNSVASAGDVNGDGFSDVVVGAYSYTGDLLSDGRAYVYLGSALGLAVSPAWITQGEGSEEFGSCVASAGDVNGDGFSDVIVGARGLNLAYIYLGSPQGLQIGPSWIGQGGEDTEWFGQSVASAGDVNGDGFSDIVIGAPYSKHDLKWEGQAFVYLGSPTGVKPEPDWSYDGSMENANMGNSVACAGDVNGDGFDDVIIGLRDFSISKWYEGRAYLFYGNAEGGPGRSVQPRTLRNGGPAPIAPFNIVNQRNLCLSVLGRTPLGRGLVKLQCEVKPYGVAFDGLGTQISADWVDTGTAGVELNARVQGLGNGLYHWRARLIHHPASIPYQPATHWFTPPRETWEMADFRILAKSSAWQSWLLYQ